MSYRVPNWQGDIANAELYDHTKTYAKHSVVKDSRGQFWFLACDDPAHVHNAPDAAIDTNVTPALPPPKVGEHDGARQPYDQQNHKNPLYPLG
jgi:hypothetical protein